MVVLPESSLWQDFWSVFIIPIIIGVIVLTIVLLIVRKITTWKSTKKFGTFKPEVFTNPQTYTKNTIWKKVKHPIKHAKAKGKVSTSTSHNWGFDSVAGAEEAVSELQELVERLKNPTRWTKWGIPAPKGALLWGPPGTGKTLLAKAVAVEAEVPFYAVSGSDFVEKYVGVGAARVRELFKQAKKEKSGAIIFIDEIDAIGRTRGSDTDVGNAEHENTLNALLVELDGFNERNNIIVMGATNRPDLIDKALTRPGRLDKKIIVPLPDKNGREKILATHIKGKPFSEDVNLHVIAGRTPGLSGAELSQIVHEACLNAERENVTLVQNDHIEHAVATVVMGKARTSAVISEKDRAITAWHEAGHATAAMVLPDADNPATVTIIPRGTAGGFTWTMGEDKHYSTVEQMKAALVVSLAGRAAEEHHLGGTFTTGPSGDYENATKIAYDMVAVYGMFNNQLISYGKNANYVSTISQNWQIKEDIQSLLGEALTEAKNLLNENLELMTTIATELLARETLNSTDLLLIQETYEKEKLNN